MATSIKARKPNNWFYSFARWLLSLFYFPVCRLKVQGRENIPQEGPVLLCSNHTAVKDPVLLGVAVPRQVFYMAKEELFRNGFIGRLLRALGAFPVLRGSGGAEALAEGERLLRENAQVGIFIEGTRSRTGELLRPKSGAMVLAQRTGAAVVPVCITGQSGKAPRLFQRTILSIGKPIPPEELDLRDGGAIQLHRAAKKVMARIAAMQREDRRALGLPELPAPGDKKSPKTDGGAA